MPRSTWVQRQLLFQDCSSRQFPPVALLSDVTVFVNRFNVSHTHAMQLLLALRAPAADGTPAPIIEVSGRTYPVEIRYRPLIPDDADTDNLTDPESDDDGPSTPGEAIDMIDGVIAAVDGGVESRPTRRTMRATGRARPPGSAACRVDPLRG